MSFALSENDISPTLIFPLRAALLSSNCFRDLNVSFNAFFKVSILPLSSIEPDVSAIKTISIDLSAD